MNGNVTSDPKQGAAANGLEEDHDDEHQDKDHSLITATTQPNNLIARISSKIEGSSSRTVAKTSGLLTSQIRTGTEGFTIDRSDSTQL
ncbi:hypothetical protein PCANC_15333 [Puccinia coronata f. sp. avenae]|uniref:Uncharacterized protein n=1 Tax=Puccinia coronata f. sp. avenae TaxID=200324 RepID=A0A2N5SXD4_9BASI|nr:hypothetical protein PCANC_15333 [Puccinia coronata f. sp. avenae]